MTSICFEVLPFYSLEVDMQVARNMYHLEATERQLQFMSWRDFMIASAVPMDLVSSDEEAVKRRCVLNSGKHLQ